MKNKIHMLPVAMLAGLLVLAVGSCSDSDGNVLGTGQGQITVSMHDQAAPQISEVNVTFNSIQVRNTSGEWVDLGLDLAGEIDILQYVGSSNTVDLTTDAVAPGTYNAVRINIASVRIVLDDASEINYAAGWQVVVNVPLEVVEEGGTSSIVLHFDVDASFSNPGGGWIFDPVITVSS